MFLSWLHSWRHVANYLMWARICHFTNIVQLSINSQKKPSSDKNYKK